MNMTETLLAFDSIAPVIGGAVLTGAFSFFSGALLSRKKSDDSNQHFVAPVVSDLEMEIQRLNRQRQSDQLEHQLVNEFIGCDAVGSSLAGFMRKIVPPFSTHFAAIIGVESNESMLTTVHGFSKQSIEQMTIPDELILRLRTENPLIVSTENDTEGLFHRLDQADREKISQLWLTGFDDGEKIIAVLVTSSLWPSELAPVGPDSRRAEPTSPTHNEQRQFMNRIARRIGKQCRQMLKMEEQSRELHSTRNMLELRGIVDSQIEEPIKILERFATRLCEMVRADRVAIYFVARRAGDKLQPIVQCGRQLPPDVMAAWHRHEQALAHIAIESEIGSLHDGGWLRNLHDDSLISSAATVPIRVNGRVLGALCLTQQFQDDSLENNRKLIEFGAVTLSQTLCRVFDDATIRRQARHDHLTDLVNRRSFDAYLEAEIERIQHGESATCSLILADLDRFKSYNDRFGHQGGDRVLCEAARVLSEQVSRLRMGDNCIVARYGGEEFAILLPNVRLAGAMRLAEEIRVAIESKSIRMGSTSIRLTISLGVADCPGQANSTVSLVAAADKALYQAKSSGRNLVCQGVGTAD